MKVSSKMYLMYSVERTPDTFSTLKIMDMRIEKRLVLEKESPKSN